MQRNSSSSSSMGGRYSRTIYEAIVYQRYLYDPPQPCPRHHGNKDRSSIKKGALALKIADPAMGCICLTLAAAIQFEPDLGSLPRKTKPLSLYQLTAGCREWNM
ncbi:hypothetical protein [Absidia glauca]|uniref:Uncharacterized protein n=1 Tax=Absidia glauca TaxID=4829 RepID=A0A168LGG3_ABSGL|nr:hypothetical protein [Absidia glauca]